jgi:hypothetical protein
MGSIRRGAALIGRQVIIQDEIDPEASGTIIWAIHTCAEPVSVTGSVARFQSGGDRFVVRILEPAAAQLELGFPPEPRAFRIADVRQLHGRWSASAEGALVSELPRRGDLDGARGAGALIRKLQIVWPRGAQRLSVALLPDCDDDGFNLPIAPLSVWLARHPVRLTRYPGPEHRVGNTVAPARGERPARGRLIRGANRVRAGGSSDMHASLAS